MDLATIEATPEEAKAKLDEYRAAVKENHDQVDAMILKGYEALEKGRSLIRLTDSFRVGGFDGKGLPRLAIARMTDETVNVSIHSASMVFAPRDRMDPRAGLNSGLVRVGVGRPWQSELRHWATAMVPIVPPTLRPARARNRHFILFEAVWEPEPPIDPALIRHLIGDLWVVLATWDLTELERAAIAAR